jgi:hypothetical protein
MLAHGFSIEQMVELPGLQPRRPIAWSLADARWRSPACGLPRKDGKRGRNDRAADSNGKLALPETRSCCYRNRSAAVQRGGSLSMWCRQAVRHLLRSPYKEIVEFRPPGAPTGYSHPRCYMGWTRDCSHTISGEHFISENVLSILNAKSVRTSGAAWISKGQTQDLPLTGLQANILCRRHNSALSPLDTMAGKLFRAIDGIYDNLGRRTLSRRPIWHLFSGEELELWLLKMIL